MSVAAGDATITEILDRFLFGGGDGASLTFRIRKDGGIHNLEIIAQRKTDYGSPIYHTQQLPIVNLLSAVAYTADEEIMRAVQRATNGVLFGSKTALSVCGGF